MTEEEIAALFDQVARDLNFPGIEAIVSEAERDGRRLRHRHTALLATGSALAAGAIVVAATATGVVPGLSGTLGFTSSAAGASPAPSGSAAGTVVSPSARPSPAATSSVAAPGPTGAPSPGASATGGMTTTQIMDDLRPILPATSTISDVRTNGPEWVDFDYNDGQGAVDFMFSIEPTSFYQRQLTCSQSPWSGTTDEGPRPAAALPQSCVMSTLHDGSIVQDWVTYADAYGLYFYNITDQRPDGTVVWVQVGNGINHGLPQVDRAVPPGSITEWNALVESPVWHL
jgi:hypothetical protein